MRTTWQTVAALMLVGGTVGVGPRAPAPRKAPGPAPTVSRFETLHFLNQRVGWAITPYGIATSSDGGRVWRWGVHLAPGDRIARAGTAVADWHGIVWVPVQARDQRGQIWNWHPGGQVHRIPSPVRASSITAMAWTSPTTGYLMADPLGPAGQFDQVQLWATTDGGGVWHPIAAPPIVGVKTGLSVGGQPRGVWIGAVELNPEHPLYHGVVGARGVQWTALPTFPIPVGLRHDGGGAAGAPVWWSPTRAVFWVNYANANTQTGPVVLYRTTDGGGRWTIGAVVPGAGSWEGTPSARVGLTEWVGVSTAATGIGGLPRATRIWAVRGMSAPRRVGTVPGFVTRLDGVSGMLWALSSVGRHHQVLWISRTGGRTWRRA
jgi:hypothetical protein